MSPPPDAGADAPIRVDTVLVPVDGSDDSARAVEYAAAIADRYDADLHAVYVHDEEVVRAIETDALDESAVAEDARTFVEEVGQPARERNVHLTSSMAYGYSTRQKSRHPGSVVLDTAEEVDADFLVIPREGARGEPGGTLERAAEYVLLYASQPVLSV